MLDLNPTALPADLLAALDALALRLGVSECADLLAARDFTAAGDAFSLSVPYAPHTALRRDAACACWALADGRVDAARECLDLDEPDADALLAADPTFETVCNERRDAWIEAQEGDLIDCRACDGTGEGWCGRRCGSCAGQGYRVHREPCDDRDGAAYAL